MLKDRITQRVLKHHGEVLACMDALEELGKAISESTAPRVEFRQHREELDHLFSFLEKAEPQHEREEENILIPMMDDPQLSSPHRQPAESFKRVCREHDLGMQLLKGIRTSLETIEADQSEDPADYYRFTSQLTDLIWHYRRHVWLENSLLASPAAEASPASSDWLSVIGSNGPRSESIDG